MKNAFLLLFLLSSLVANAQKWQGFFKPLPTEAEGAPIDPVTSKWQFRPTVTLPALKIVEADNADPANDAKVSAQILTSVGGGVALQKLKLDTNGNEDKWKSQFSWSPITILLSGNVKESNATLNLAPATTVGFFNNVLMFGVGYDLGNVNGRSRWFGLLSVGINFNN